MQKDTACRFQNPVHLLNTLLEPSNVMIHAAAPSVLKTSDFASIAPNHFIVPITEKWRVKIDQVYRVAVNGF